MTRLIAIVLALFASVTYAVATQLYFEDNFQDTAYTNYFWRKACSTTPHNVGRSYPKLGTARYGYCWVPPRANQFMRFQVQPFDIRDDEDMLRLKGGAEIVGKFPQRLEDTKYSWDFRLWDLSMLTSGLTKHFFVHQFHSVDKPECGPALVNSSPSPGLDVSMSTPDQVTFTLLIKPVYSQIGIDLKPFVNVGKCSLQPDQSCQVILWKETYPLAEVYKVWIHIVYRIKFSQTDGTLSFAFGREDYAGSIGFQQRIFQNGVGTLVVPTTVNACPYVSHLGIYALSYPSDYYGTEGDRATYGPDWASARMTTEYDRFIKGTQTEGENPPSLIIDIDNYKINDP